MFSKPFLVPPLRRLSRRPLVVSLFVRRLCPLSFFERCFRRLLSLPRFSSFPRALFSRSLALTSPPNFFLLSPFVFLKRSFLSFVLFRRRSSTLSRAITLVLLMPCFLPRSRFRSRSPSGSLFCNLSFSLYFCTHTRPLQIDTFSPYCRSCGR